MKKHRKNLNPLVDYSHLSEEELKCKSARDIYTVLYLNGNNGLTDDEIGQHLRTLGVSGYAGIALDCTVRGQIYRWNKLVGKKRVIWSRENISKGKGKYYFDPEYAKQIFVSSKGQNQFINNIQCGENSETFEYDFNLDIETTPTTATTNNIPIDNTPVNDTLSNETEERLDSEENNQTDLVELFGENILFSTEFDYTMNELFNDIF